MKVQVVPNWSCGGYTVGLEQGDKEFVFDYHASPARAAQIESDFRHALAAHDAELDKTRFVELTKHRDWLLGETRRLREFKDQEVPAYYIRGFELRDARIRVLESDLEAARELAAGRLKCANNWQDKYHRVRDAVKKIAEGGF